MKEFMSPSFILLSSIYGMISGYLAYRRKKNPYKWFLIGFCFGLVGIAFFLFPQKKKRAPVHQRQISVLLGPTDKLWYYLDASMQQIGPMSYQAIAKALTEKTISLETYVWHESLTEWKKLSDLIHNRSESHDN